MSYECRSYESVDEKEPISDCVPKKKTIKKELRTKRVKK